MVLIENIKEAWQSSQVKDIKDKLGAVFEARSKTVKDETDKVNEAELAELSAEEVIKMGLFAVFILWESMAAVFELDFKVINFLNKLIFTAWHAGKFISNVDVDIKFDDLFDQNKDSEHFACCTLAD